MRDVPRPAWRNTRAGAIGARESHRRAHPRGDDDGDDEAAGIRTERLRTEGAGVVPLVEARRRTLGRDTGPMPGRSPVLGPEGRQAVERLGRRPAQLPIAVGRHRRPEPRQPSATESEVGLRVPERPARDVAAVDCRRPRLRRQRDRHRLRARCRDRLHVLVVQGRRHGAHGDQRRHDDVPVAGHRPAARRADARVLRRSEWVRLRPGRRYGRAPLESPSRLARGGDHHRRAEVLRRAPVRAGLVVRGRRRRRAEVRLLHLPWQRRRARCLHRPQHLADVPGRGAEADRRQQARREDVRAFWRRRLVLPHRRCRAQRRVRRDRRQLLAAGLGDERCRRRARSRDGTHPLAPAIEAGRHRGTSRASARTRPTVPRTPARTTTSAPPPSSQPSPERSSASS